MKLSRFVPAAAVVLLVATQTASATPDPQESPHHKQATVTCSSASFYFYPRMASPTDRPMRSSSPAAGAGQRFEALRMRTTLQSVQYVETNVPAGTDLDAAPHSHLWLLRNCVSVG